MGKTLLLCGPRNQGVTLDASWKAGLSQVETYLAIANIWLLVEMNELREDEFNGLQFVYGM